MYRLTIILLILSIVSMPAVAETTIGFELYPEKMDGIFDSPNFNNGKEWFATTVEIEKTFFDHLNIRFNIKTYLFGTNGISYYPSSVKFTNSISYQFGYLKVGYEHYCHHYFHQFENNYSSQNKLTFVYSF